MNKTLLPKVYTPADYEEDIFYKWENSGFFNPDNLPGERKKAFSICLPPPNVTGQLHIGHAAMLAYQDIMIRYHRLKGEKTLWLPGMDHAAIATQSVVEKQLNKEGQTRYDLGRQKFLERINQFAEKSKATIRNQIKAMGASLDWSREKFTLDEDVSKAVSHVFKKMYDDGLIYRGDRVVNWCPKCQSTLSDDEVEYKEAKGQLYYIKYGSLTIATTRPETKLGDTGVAVNSKDERYKKLIGQELNINLAGHKIKVKVFSDRAVDMEFGTGAIGVTPGHSQQDFLWAEEYNLPLIKIINEQGKMTAEAGKYQGLSTLECRDQFVSDLEKAGLIEKIEDYNNNLSVCYRCGTVIEPLTSLQWFVDVNKKIPQRGKSLKQLAGEVVKNGEIKIIPDRFNKTYFQWMDNLRDWCVSRQIWYGHRIPVWYKSREQSMESNKQWNLKIYGKDIFKAIIDGRKTIETRAGRKKGTGKDWSEFKPGDIINFSLADEKTDQIINSTESVVRKIKKVSHFKTIDDLFKEYQSAQDYPGCSVSQIKKWWAKHPDLNARIDEFGIWAFELEEASQKEEFIVPQKITELVLMRHGITDWNKEDRLQGRTNVPLDESNIGKIKELIPQIKSEQFDCIVSSSLMRARQTAEIIGQELNLPLEISDLLTERDYGSFEGKMNKEIYKEHPGYKSDKINYDIPGEGEESYQELAKRVEKFIEETDKKYANKKILVICHNAVMRAFKMTVDEASTEELSNYKPEFGELAVYQILDGRYKLKNYRQDPDTLDTWFSSALWTFSTLGWPKTTKDFKTFHPTSVMETGYDILFFWVARMIMMSTYLLKEKPFETVYLHGLVRTKTGEKMSKSKPETCIDPLEMIKKYGTDALRLSMIIGSSPGNDVRLYEEKIAGYRNFVNKLWNISRYILFSVKEVKRYTIHDTRYTTLADRWILAELHSIINSTTKNIEEFNFSRAGEDLYEFTWNKLADWYLEIAKIEGDKDATLLHILEKLLILWHPFCPYVTEVLWEEFRTKELLMAQKWPKNEVRRTKSEERVTEEFAIIQEIITSIRNIRVENIIAPQKIYNCSIKSKYQKLIDENQKIIEGLVKVKITPKCSGMAIHLSHSEITLDINQNKGVKRKQTKEIINLKRYVEIQTSKLNNQDFFKKAPKAVVEREKEKLNQAREKLNKLTS